VQRFGEHIPLIRRHDVKGFITRRPVWLVRPLGISAVRKQAEIMELETRQFYERAQERSPMRPCASCSAIWRKPSASTRPPPSRSMKS
jgi:hypothetical protein